MNGSTPNGLEGIVAELAEMADGLEKRVEEMRESLRVQEAELRRVQQMIRTAVGDKRQYKKRKPLSPRYGEEELTILLDKVRNLPPVVDDIPGSFSTRHLREHLGISKPVAERAVNYLRDTGYIRMVGSRKLGNGGRESRLYVVNDVE